MRVFLCTFPKAGSQWARDLLLDHRVVAATRLVPVDPQDVFPRFRVPGVRRAAIADQSMIGPVYNSVRRDIVAGLSAGDRVVFIGRDPRDMAVSRMFSILYSHEDASSLAKRALEGALRTAGERDRLLLSAWSLCATSGPAYLSWCTEPDSETVLRTNYERLVADTEGELQRILAFLGCELAPDLIAGVVKDHSFVTRAGRAPGQEDIYSHFRKGVPGEWRTFFDREMGRCWEEMMPGLLVAAGYERTGDWWRELPERAAVGLSEAANPGSRTDREVDGIRRELVRSRERTAQAERICAERLELIQRLDALARDLQRQCVEKEAEINRLLGQASERP